MQFSFYTEDRRLSQPFSISRETIETTEVIVVELGADGVHGWGECAPQGFLGQSIESEAERLESIRGEVERDISREALADLLPACSARNALDCALWDLEAKRDGKTVWEIAGLAAQTEPLEGDMTVGLGTPEWMHDEAKRYANFSMLKIKLNRERVVERVSAVREGAPNSRFMVDINEDWTLDELKEYAPQIKELGVEMIEQPLRRGEDAGLIDYQSPIPLGADESCYDRSDLDFLEGRYQLINIKLDKTGGLTEALALAREAESRGFGLMVGCMVGTSLAMAPGFVVASLCKYRDLDGASMLAEDRTPSLRLENGLIYPYEQSLWG